MSRRSRSEYPGVTWYKDRHKKRRWRYRGRGSAVDLGTTYGSPEFVERYKAAVSGEMPSKIGAKKIIPKSIADLVSRYYKSAEFINLKASSKATYRGIIDRFAEAHGEKRVALLGRRHIKLLLDEKASTPFAANNLRDRLKALMDLAINLEWRKDNPVSLVKAISKHSDGFHTWTEEEIKRYYEFHPLGSVAYTAMTIMLYTGAARCDAVKLGQGNIAQGRLRYRRKKRETLDGVLIDIPIHPDLAAAIARCPPDAFTFLQTAAGKSRSANGLGNSMRDWCDKAGLPECTAHGLRKAIARRLAEAGATPHEIAAVTGHKSLRDVEIYTRQANRSLMADGGIAKLSQNRRRTE